MADVNYILQQMQGVRAFILYQLIPKSDGNLDKVPVNPQSGYNCDPHNPDEWMLPDQAFAWLNRYGQGYGIGIIISEQIVLPNGLKLFCLDLDKCRDGNQWLPHAASFCARFPGALVECSVSGNGLHIFGCYRGERPDHGVKNKIYRMELYSKLRFIAITGIGAAGSMLTDQTTAFQRVATEYFPPHDDANYEGALTEAPVAEWRGPDDDDELLRRALRSHSAAVVFGGKASFADLFNANVDVLARVFPPFKFTPYDESGADQAAANHLAFWTGNHGVRIERLMRRSKLARAKWDLRPNYLTATINRACGSQKQWYKDHRLESPELAPGLNPVLVAPSIQSLPSAPGALFPSTTVKPKFRLGDLLIVQQQLELFAGCVYVQDVHQIMMPEGYLLSSERFNAQFSGWQYAITPEGQRPSKHAWEAFVQSEAYHFPKVKGAFFDPLQDAHTIIDREGWTFINTWVPITIKRTSGDITPFLNHVKKILPLGNDAEILIDYFKAVVQHPGKKFQWWPFIQGVEGNGKTILSELLEAAVGERYTHWPKASEIGGKFNAAYYGKLLILVEDVKISESQHSLWETLKPMITGKKLEIEAKGIDKVTREICFNGVLNSNHKNGIRKTRNDRRVCPFFCAQQSERDLVRDGLTLEYFIEFRNWIDNGGSEAVAYYLLNTPIRDEWNPATHAFRPPATTATEEAISAGLGTVEQEILEFIQQGQPGFRNGWVSSAALDRMLGVMGKASAVPRNKRRDILETLGYIPHPALPDGRAPSADTDGTRPRLYVRATTQGVTETIPAQVMAWYQAAQR